jgi:putative transcriptional regulator
MIKHHPTEDMLIKFVDGSLPTPFNVAISAHLELCSECKTRVLALENKSANDVFKYEEEGIVDLDYDLSFMLDLITADNSISHCESSKPVSIDFSGKEVTLPNAFNNYSRSDFSRIGKISRSRFESEDNELRASLLHIEAGGEIPNHTHTGFEITLLLEGQFEDESGVYNKGDFIWLDGSNSHSPKSKEGCICFTLVNSALHFNKGLSKLLNPIGKLIY